MQLGNHISQALSLVGLTEESVSHWLGKPCKCAERREKLNELGLWARQAIRSRREDAARWLRGILES